MSTSDSRPAFRLPWQSAPDAEGTSEQAAASSVEPPAWPHHDLVRRIGAAPDPDPVPVPATSEEGAGPGPNGRTVGSAPGVSSAALGNGGTLPAGPAATTATPPHRRPTKFLADLTRAMRQAADESRDATLAQCQADIANHIDAARAQAESAAGEARRRADEDVAALGDWSKAEFARIERETAANTAARRVGLKTELAEQQARLELEVERVADQAKAFEAEMETFFVQLLHEEDPSAFAAMASQLPEPPVFEPWRPDMDPTASDAATPRPTGNGTRSGGKKSRAAAADAASGESAATAGQPTELSADEVQTRIGAPSAGMPAMRPDDFAAAEAEAAHWASDAPAAPVAAEGPVAASGAARHEATVTSETTATVTADVAAQDAVAWPKPRAAAAAEPASGIRTQISVTGLVSVASIAAFKRLLSRVQGVGSVQVASGPNGEFLFAVQHEEHVDLAAAVMRLQGFDAQIVKSAGGVISVAASDPEAA